VEGVLEANPVQRADAEIVMRSIAEPELFALLVRRHSHQVHSYLFRRSNRQTADDLFGEVWLRAFHARRTYDPIWRNARPWLFGIAGNVLRAHWRRRVVDHDQRFELTDDPWPLVDRRLEADGQRAALEAALGDLRPEDREVLLLVAGEQLTPAEVAVTLGIPQGSARRRLHQARMDLQARFDARGVRLGAACDDTDKER
jgi:RNA polymerase sigma factor (sigma-70 family)